MKKRWLKILLALLFIVPFSLWLILTTELGSRWLIQTALPKEAKIDSIQGDLLSRLELKNLTYQTEEQDIAITTTVFEWLPSQLIIGTLNLVEFSIDGANIKLSDKAKPEEPPSEPFDFDAPLALPLDVILKTVSITNLDFQQGETQQHLDKLQLSIKTEQGFLKLTQIDLLSPLANAHLQGEVQLGKGFPFNLNADWTVKHELAEFKASTKLSGNTKNIHLENDLKTPFSLSIKTDIKNPLKEPDINAHIVWRDVVYPFQGEPLIKSSIGRITFEGLLSNYHLQLKTALQQQYLPDTSVSLDSHGSLEAITIHAFDVLSRTGKLHLDGKAGWKDKTTFDIRASGEEFNPAVFAPDITGNLSFNAQCKGQMTDKLELTAAIDKLTGQLHGYSVSLDGNFALSGEDLTVNELNLDSGRNHIAVNGSLGSEQAALDLAINVSELNTLWKGLAGKLNAQGHLQGALKNPSANVELAGQGIRFQQHGVESLKLAVNYDATGKQASDLQLTVANIKTGETKIQAVSLNAQGSPEQHSLTADIKSELANLQTQITGGLKDKNWQGALEKLNIQNKQAGAWQLNNALVIQAQQTDAGLNLKTGKTCLMQNSAALCLQGQLLANGDFVGAVLIESFSSQLIAPFLPPDIKLQTELNADANVQQIKGKLAGNYQLKLSPIGLTVQDKNLQLGATAINGTLNGTRINTDLNIGLFGQDSLQGQIQLNTDASQSLAGQINATISEFTPVKAFAPQLASITGLLNSQIKLAGTLKKPLVQGNIDLNNAGIKLADSEFSVHDINLHIKATSSDSNHIELQGALNPELKNLVATRISLNADVQQHGEQLTGHYQLDIPPTTVQLPQIKLPLGATHLTGKLSDKKIEADLKMALIKQDYLNAQLQLAFDATKTLAGNINASIKEFETFNALVPQVSGLKGQLLANLKLSGTTDKPNAQGSVSLNGGALNIADIGLQLQQLNVNAQSLGDRIQLTGGVKSGEGSLKLNGALNLTDGFPLDLSINGDNFQVAKRSDAEVAISPKLNLTYNPTGANLTGSVFIPKAVIQLQDIPESAIAVSEDEIIMGETVEKTDNKAPTAVNAKLDIELGKNVNFTGFGLKTDLQGKLQLTKTGDKMAMYGNVNMDKARFKKYGQDLTVRKGKFVFNGATDAPFLDVEASRLSNDQKITAILSVQGTPDNLKTRIYAEPSLAETEALAYLITGKPLAQISQGEGNSIAGAALSYGAGQAAWLTQKLGIDEFEVQEGKTLKDTMLAVGQYLTPDFYVGAKVNVFNKQVAVVLKHKITENLNVETQAGESQRIKLNYELDTD